MTQIIALTPIGDNPWLFDFSLLSNNELKAVWPQYANRDTSRWMGPELAAFEVAKQACWNELARRGLAL